GSWSGRPRVANSPWPRPGDANRPRRSRAANAISARPRFPMSPPSPPRSEPRRFCYDPTGPNSIPCRPRFGNRESTAPAPGSAVRGDPPGRKARILLRLVPKEHSENFRVALANIGDAVITTDADGRITFLHPVDESSAGRGGDPPQENARLVGEVVEQLRSR